MLSYFKTSQLKLFIQLKTGFRKRTGNKVPLCVVSHTRHICHVYGWWHVDADFKTTYAQFLEAPWIEQIAQAFHYFTVQ